MSKNIENLKNTKNKQVFVASFENVDFYVKMLTVKEMTDYIAEIEKYNGNENQSSIIFGLTACDKNGALIFDVCNSGHVEIIDNLPLKIRRAIDEAFLRENGLGK